MDTPNRRLPFFAAVFTLLFFVSSDALAFCSPILQFHRYVGDTASDSQCTDNDIQSAINNVTCPNTTIVITREHTYTNQHLTINNNSMTITAVGDGVGCGSSAVTCDPAISNCDGNPTPTAPLVTLDGSNTAGSVLEITGSSNVSLNFLEIKGGCVGSSCGVGSGGGGIEFSGNGTLTLNTVTVDHNQADYGGGIDVATSGGAASLTLNANTIVEFNNANLGGGGIHVVGTGDGQATFTMTQPALIYHNAATGGYGGGINVVGNAQASIGSPGLLLLGAIESNSATYGGGMAVTSNSDGVAEAYLYATQANSPISIQNNTASLEGGGIYESPSYDFSDINGAYVWLWDYQLLGNAAPEGAATYSDLSPNLNSTFSSSLFLNIGTPPSGSVRCTPSLSCNAISDNINRDANGNAFPGATIFLRDAEFEAEHLIMRGNTGAYAIHAILENDNASQVLLNNCLLVDNSYSSGLISNDNPADATITLGTRISNCTLAHNAIASGFVLNVAGGAFTLKDSIIDQSGVPILNYSGAAGDLTVSQMLTSSSATLPTQPDIVQGTPTYLNAATGDYHLLPDSLGVDFAPAAGGTDLDNNPRDVDLPDVPNFNGPRDLGAYEVQITNLKGYVGLTPAARILDTRSGATTVDGEFAAGGRVTGGGQIDLTVLGRGGVPATGVSAVVLNVTLTGPAAPGFETVWPTGSTRPVASNVNFSAGQTIPNLVIVKVGTGGDVSLYTSASAGSTDVIADVVGYFTDTAALTALVPGRILDTRVGQTTVDGEFAGIGAVAAHTQLDLTVAGRDTVPATGVGAVILNVTATNPTAAGFITVWPTDAARPNASNLNFLQGETISNLVVSKVSDTGTVSLYTNSTTDLIADVMGWFPTVSELTPLVPARLLDTRAGETTIDGQFQGIGPLPSQTIFALQVAGRGNVPSTGAGSVILNVTVTNPTATGFLTVWPNGTTRPLASNLNYVAGQTIPNLVIVDLNASGKVSLFANAGSPDVVVDVVGWFATP